MWRAASLPEASVVELGVEAPRAEAERAAATGPGSRILRRRALIAFVGGVVALNVIGLPYFLLPIGERLRSPLHAWFKPSGYVGQSTGILTLALFAFMYLYPLRKRFRRLAFLGSIVRWLDLHIVAGVLIPLLGATHASWRFGGLIGLGFLAMLLVSLSGVVGKYIYTRIPRGRSGLEMTLEQIEEQRRELSLRIARTAALDPGEIESMLAGVGTARASSGMFGAIRALVGADLARFRSLHELRRHLKSAGGRTSDRATLNEAVGLARRQIALSQQLLLLESTHRVFRFWHVVHRPFSITAFVAVTIHVVVVVALGVTWFR